MKSNLYYWLPVVAYMALIFTLSAQSRLPLDETIALHDKALHAVEYGGLSALSARAFLHASALAGRTLASGAAGAALAVLYAGSDEWHQSLVPERHFDRLDLAADATGAFLACLAFPLYARRHGPPAVPGRV